MSVLTGNHCSTSLGGQYSVYICIVYVMCTYNVRIICLPNKICAQFVIVSGALTGARLQQGAGDVSSLQERTC